MGIMVAVRKVASEARRQSRERRVEMNFLGGLQLLLLYLQISGTIHWNWGIVMLPIIVDTMLSAIAHEVRRARKEEVMNAIKDIIRQECENDDED